MGNAEIQEASGVAREYIRRVGERGDLGGQIRIFFSIGCDETTHLLDIFKLWAHDSLFDVKKETPQNGVL